MLAFTAQPIGGKKKFLKIEHVKKMLTLLRQTDVPYVVTKSLSGCRTDVPYVVTKKFF